MLKGLKPVSWSRRFLASDLPYDMGIAAVSLFGGIAAAWRFWTANPPDKLAAKLAWGLAVVAFLFVMSKAIKNYKIASSKLDDSPIEGLLHAIRSILQETGIEKDPTLRIALYVPDKNGLVQFTNYIGPVKPGGKGNRLTFSQGVEGAAFRTGQESFSKLPSGDNVVDFLTSTHGFTREEAARRNPTRKEWIAVPIGEPDKIFAVITCDSATPSYFGNKSSQRRKVLTGAIEGVAAFLLHRYN